MTIKRVLKVTEGTGVTSCLSVRLDNICAYRKDYRRYPDAVDSSRQFWWYKEEGDERDVSGMFLDRYMKPPFILVSDFNHGWQFAWYDEIGWEDLRFLVKLTCSPSPNILERSVVISESYIKDRIVVLYRGNDKAKEIEPTPYKVMIEAAYKAAVKAGHERFYVQTDELDFYARFCHYFPDTIYLPTLPMIARNPDRYVMPPNKLEFALEFYASLVAMSWSKHAVITTGNTGLWLTLYRSGLPGLIQCYGNRGYKIY